MLEMQAFVESLRSRRVGDVSSGGGNEPLQTGDPQSPFQEEVTADVQTPANRIALASEGLGLGDSDVRFPGPAIASAAESPEATSTILLPTTLSTP